MRNTFRGQLRKSCTRGRYDWIFKMNFKVVVLQVVEPIMHVRTRVRTSVSYGYTGYYGI